MKRLLNWFCRTHARKATGACGRRLVHLQLEQLGDRLVPSTLGLSSAIHINHPTFVERDWYSIDQFTHQVVEVQGVTRKTLGGPKVFEVSASVDPNTGFGEVYALSNSGTLWRCDSAGNWWNTFVGAYKGISATRDGGVYAVTLDGKHVIYWNFKGIPTDLSAPNPGTGPWANNSLAASIGWFGSNEVFAIGPNQALYVNSTNMAGQWRLVDNTQAFVAVSASPNDTVFALTVGGKLYEETEHFTPFPFPHFFWAHQDVSGGRTYSAISADTDSAGQAEVYGIQAGTHLAYQYDKGPWTLKDADVFDISGADGGYFYDVHYAAGNYIALQYNPFAVPHWTFLGQHLL
jgi:hypothetical protein